MSRKVSGTSQLKVAENEDVFVTTAEQESMHEDATAESDNTPTTASALTCNDVGYLKFDQITLHVCMFA